MMFGNFHTVPACFMPYLIDIPVINFSGSFSAISVTAW